MLRTPRRFHRVGAASIPVAPAIALHADHIKFAQGFGDLPGAGGAFRHEKRITFTEGLLGAIRAGQCD